MGWLLTRVGRLLTPVGLLLTFLGRFSTLIGKPGTRLKISPRRLIIAPLGLIIAPFNFNNRPIQLKTASAPVFNRSRITKNKLERQTPMTYYYILWKYNFARYTHFKYVTWRKGTMWRWCWRGTWGQCEAVNSINHRGLNVYKVYFNLSIFSWFINSSHQKILYVYMVYLSCLYSLSINHKVLCECLVYRFTWFTRVVCIMFL